MHTWKIKMNLNVREVAMQMKIFWIISKGLGKTEFRVQMTRKKKRENEKKGRGKKEKGEEKREERREWSEKRKEWGRGIERS